MVFPYLSEDHIPALRVQPGGGFVQHQKPRFHGKHTCNGHTALLPAGKLKGAALQKAAVNAAERGRTLHDLS